MGGLDNADTNVTNTKSELIDPISHKVAVLPQTLVGRLHQTVSVTADERVVQAGGVVRSGDYWSTVDRVDVLDTKTRRWTDAAPMHAARSDHAAVTLKDGRVMVIGGNHDAQLLSSVEIYDVHANTWTMAAPLPRPRTQHSAVVLADGRVLVVGGIDSDGGATDTTFVYDPATNRWGDGPRMTQARLQEAIAVLPSGDILFVGGDGSAGSTSEIYLAREQRFVASGLLNQPRFVAQAAALPDGRVVVNGGLPPRVTRFTPLSSTEIWTPSTGQWNVVAPSTSPRAWAKLIWDEGALFLVSGTGLDETAIGSVERLTVE